VFLINLPIIAVMLALVPRLPAGKRFGGGGSVDVRGALLVTTGIAALIFGLSSGQQHGFTAPATIIALALAVLLTTGFVFAEKRSAAPMLPLSILAEPARRAAIAAMLLIGAILAGYVYFASLYLQKVLGFSPVATGLALVPSTVTVVLVSTLGTRRLLARFSIKAVLLAGLACMGAGQLWLAQITAGASYPAAVLPRAGADRGRGRARTADRVDRDHQRSPGQRPGTGRRPVHHQPADRRRGRAGDPRHRGRGGHRRP
jgi:hypothetical protein